MAKQYSTRYTNKNSRRDLKNKIKALASNKGSGKRRDVKVLEQRHTDAALHRFTNQKLVQCCLEHGDTAAQIAEYLGVSIRTVRRYIKAIKENKDPTTKRLRPSPQKMRIVLAFQTLSILLNDVSPRDVFDYLKDEQGPPTMTTIYNTFGDVLNWSPKMPSKMANSDTPIHNNARYNWTKTKDAKAYDLAVAIKPQDRRCKKTVYVFADASNIDAAELKVRKPMWGSKGLTQYPNTRDAIAGPKAQLFGFVSSHPQSNIFYTYEGTTKHPEFIDCFTSYVKSIIADWKAMGGTGNKPEKIVLFTDGARVHWEMDKTKMARWIIVKTNKPHRRRVYPWTKSRVTHLSAQFGITIEHRTLGAYASDLNPTESAFHPLKFGLGKGIFEVYPTWWSRIN